VYDARLPSLHNLERVDTAKHPQVAEGARAAGGVSSQETTEQSQELSSGWTVMDPELGLYFWRGDVEVALRYGDCLKGLKELKVEPLKERRRHLENGFFKVSNLTSLF